MQPPMVDLRALPFLVAIEEMGFRAGRASLVPQGCLCAFKVGRPTLTELVEMNPGAFKRLADNLGAP